MFRCSERRSGDIKLLFQQMNSLFRGWELLRVSRGAIAGHLACAQEQPFRINAKHRADLAQVRTGGFRIAALEPAPGAH